MCRCRREVETLLVDCICRCTVEERARYIDGCALCLTLLVMYCHWTGDSLAVERLLWIRGSLIGRRGKSGSRIRLFRKFCSAANRENHSHQTWLLFGCRWQFISKLSGQSIVLGIHLNWRCAFWTGRDSEAMQWHYWTCHWVTTGAVVWESLEAARQDKASWSCREGGEWFYCLSVFARKRLI